MDRATKRLHTAQVLQVALHENRASDQAAINYPVKKYADGMKLNSLALTVKRTVLVASKIGLVPIRCLLATKKGKKKKYI